MKRTSILLTAVLIAMLGFMNANAQGTVQVEHQILQNGNVAAVYHFYSSGSYTITSSEWTLSTVNDSVITSETITGNDSTYVFNANYFPYENGTYIIDVTVHYEINGITYDASGDDEFTYSIQGNGCDLEAWYYIDYPSAPNVGDGSINLVVTGGSGQYTFQWNTGASMQMLDSINPGTYSVTISDVQDPNCSVVLYDIYVEALDSFDYSNIVDTFSTVVDTCLPSFDVDTFYLNNLSWNFNTQDTTFSITWNFEVNGNTFSFVEDYIYDEAGYYWLAFGFNCNETKATTSYGRSVYVDPSSIESVQELNGLTSINIYPNPVNNVMVVDINKANNSTVEIYSITGKLISSQKLTSTHNIINTSKLDKGVYMVIIKENGNVVKSEKIVK